MLNKKRAVPGVFFFGAFLFSLIGCRTKMTEENLAAKARAIHDRILTVDTHCDTTSRLPGGTWDIGVRLLDPERRGVGQTTFAEDAKAAELTPADLLQEGYTREELETLGFSKADLDGAERR